MARNLNFRSKGTDHARAPRKPGRTFARQRDQWIAERMPAHRKRLARHRLAIRSAKAGA